MKHEPRWRLSKSVLGCHWSFDLINEVRWLLDLTHGPKWRLSNSGLGYHLSYDQINEVKWLLDLTHEPRWRLSKSVLGCHWSYDQINEPRWLLDLTHGPRWRVSNSGLACHWSYDQINEVRWLLDLMHEPRWRLSKFSPALSLVLWPDKWSKMATWPNTRTKMAGIKMSTVLLPWLFLLSTCIVHYLRKAHMTVKLWNVTNWGQGEVVWRGKRVGVGGGGGGDVGYKESSKWGECAKFGLHNAHSPHPLEVNQWRPLTLSLGSINLCQKIKESRHN